MSPVPRSQPNPGAGRGRALEIDGQPEVGGESHLSAERPGFGPTVERWKIDLGGEPFYGVEDAHMVLSPVSKPSAKSTDPESMYRTIPS